MPMIGMNGQSLFNDDDTIDNLIDRQEEVIREMTNIIYENTKLKVNLNVKNFISTVKANKQLKKDYKAYEKELELIIECLQDYGY